MCGIVGYLGDKDPKDVILSGLRKLEYRGYDSAGIAALHDGTTKRIRALGKLRALEEKLSSEKFNGKVGIGHTRWATHGVPSEVNAHPHFVDGISIVHNGIIENYQEIKKELLQNGAKIQSETDSELIAHLVARECSKGLRLHEAVENTLERLEGAFACLVFSEQCPDEIIAFKDGPPMVLGIGENENYVASDVQALIAYTKKFIYLEDREVAVVKRNSVQVYSEHGVAIQKKEVVLNWNPELVEKQGFEYFMLKEIHEQPRALANCLEAVIDKNAQKVRFAPAIHEPLTELFRGVTNIHIVACGTSYYAGLQGKYFFEKLARLSVNVDISSEFRYRNPVFDGRSAVFVISQSGETADTLAVVKLAKEKGVPVVSICNSQRSSIERESSIQIPMLCGPEIGVASTKAFTSTVLILNALSLLAANVRGALTEKEEKEYVKSLLPLPSQVDTLLAYDKYFTEAAKSLQHFRGFLFMGRGVSYPIALEGALKLKELAYLHAEGYAAGEMKHGPLALIDERMAVVMIAPHDDLYEKTVSNLEEARARGAKILAIGTGENAKLKEVSNHYFALPKASWTVNPILSVIPLQLMAFHMAQSLGYDVDQPRNLAKSVTVE